MNDIFGRLKEASTYGGVGVIILGASMIETNLYVAIAVIAAGVVAVLRKEFGN